MLLVFYEVLVCRNFRLVCTYAFEVLRMLYMKRETRQYPTLFVYFSSAYG